MATVLFIHGTGVRGAGIEHFLDLLRINLQRIRPEVALSACRWGDALGANLLAGGVSIPRGQGNDGLQARETSSSEGQLARWLHLDADPLRELEALALQHADAPLSPCPPDAGWSEKLQQALNHGSNVQQAIQEAGLDTVALEAQSKLGADQDFLRLANDLRIGESAQAHVIARAFTAKAIHLLDQRLGAFAPVDGEHRYAVELAVASALEPQHNVAEPLELEPSGIAAGLFFTLVTQWLIRHHETLTKQAVPAVGDVLKYLARGAKLRDFIRRSIAEINDDQIIIIGHSLGALAAMDLLLEEQIAAVTHLVAVGSPIGLLYELDALPSRHYEKGWAPGPGFPLIHNIYDPHDFLAYLNAELFGAGSTDHQIDSHTPFPRSHNAYFGNQQFYDLLDSILP